MAERIVGIDYGDSRIGVAMSDPMGWFASALETVPSKNCFNKAVQHIADIISQYGVKKVVVGWPRNMNGSEGGSAEKVAGFISALIKVCGDDTNIIKWDERLSTVSAQRTLQDLNMRGPKNRNVIDKMAAQVILQNFLDSRPKTS